jgi:hypothetical protein
VETLRFRFDQQSKLTPVLNLVQLNPNSNQKSILQAPHKDFSLESFFNAILTIAKGQFISE